MHVPLEAGLHLVRVSRNPSRGLVDECARLLGDVNLRRSIGRAAEDYFDRYLAPEQLGAYYLDRLALADARGAKVGKAHPELARCMLTRSRRRRPGAVQVSQSASV